MPRIRFSHVRKDYGGFRAITDFNAEFEDKEFLVLLGPSGCGKSTLLRMIAGLTDVTDGEIEFDGTVVNNLDPRERDVAFVFQSYALYPHLTVAQNIAFPLFMERFRWFHHLPFVGGVYKRVLSRRTEIRKQIASIAEMVGIEEELDKRPGSLSGGQRQRVALARALVRDPSLYLLDEPLSNLDAKLRSQTRAEITALHRRTGKTFVYVTHDQVEAMTMGTQIVVLNRGVVQQIGPPAEIYRNPANTFVAQFIGSPAMNLFSAEAGDGRVSVVSPEGGRWSVAVPGPPSKRTGPLLLGIRPESVRVHPASPAPGGPDDGSVRGTVVDVEHLGPEVIVSFVLGRSVGTPTPGDVTNGELFHSRTPSDPGVELGGECLIEFGSQDVSYFDTDTGDALSPVPVAPEGAGHLETDAEGTQ